MSVNNSDGDLVLSGLDPTDLCVCSDGTVAIATLTEVGTSLSPQLPLSPSLTE